MGAMEKIARLFRAAEAVPPGAHRPSMTMWIDPSHSLPPVSWAPWSGEFRTHWDWQLADALAIPGVWHARMLISQAIGGMTIGAWRGSEPVEPTPQVVREPSPGEDRANTVAAWVCDLLDHGNALGVLNVHYTDEAVPRRIVDSVTPWPASDVEIGRSDSGPVWYRFGGGTPIDASRVFHAKGVSRPGDLRGMGVLEAHLSTLSRITAESSYASRAFASGVPSGLLRVKDPDLQPGTDGDEAGFVTAKAIKKQWMSSVSSGEVAVLSDLVDFTPLSWSPEASQMVEARQLSLTDIAGMFNMDGFWLGAPSAPMVYQNVQQAAVQLSRFTLGFPITALEGQFSRLLPRGQQARFNRDTILRDDLNVRADFYGKALGDGWMTIDEVRELEGLAPMPAGELSPVTPLFPDGDSSNEKAVSA